MSTSPAPVLGRRAPQRVLVTLLAALVVALALAALLRHGSGTTSSGITGSGIPVVERRSVSPFTAVELAGANQVVIHVGGSESLNVHADSNLVDHVTTAVTHGRLVVGTTGSFRTKSPMRVVVTVPSLKRVALSGSGVIAVDGMRGPSLTAGLSGSGLLAVTGSVTRLDATLDGSGDVNLAGLDARDVKAALAGTGRLVVTASRRLSASASGSGAIVYGGNPRTVEQSVSGMGAIVRR